MFEKEAEEYSNNWKINKNNDLNFAELVELRAVIYKANKDGAEFGYNKAKKEMQGQEFNLRYENGIYKYKDKSGKEFESTDGKTWKEIVLPKDQLEVFENYINDIPNVIDPCSQCQFKDRSIWDNLEKCKECCYYYPSNFKIETGKTNYERSSEEKKKC